MYQLDGKVALVTGAANGIGRAIALRLADEGCDIGLFDYDSKGAEQTAELVREKGRRSAVTLGNAAHRGDVEAGVRALEEALGSTDILVNNAGVLRISPLLQTVFEDWDLQFRVNVDGIFHFCQVVATGMVERRQGRVINMASWLGKHGVANYGAYCASKFAVIGLTQSLATELAAHGVRANAVCPGIIEATRMRTASEVIHKENGLPTARDRVGTVPLGRLGLPEDVARVVAFLASDESDYMTGQSINISGGLWFH